MNNEDWVVSCLPEGEEFEPSPEELENFYVSLESGNIPELDWKCPGKKAPSPDAKEEPRTLENSEKDTSNKNNDFDFMDDVALPQMRVRNQNSAPKGSAKKKTAIFADVLDALKKHKLSQNKAGTN